MSISANDDALNVATLTPAPESPPEGTAAPPNPDCPKCGAKLIDPAGLGWCSKCGYCRSTQEGGAGVLAEAGPKAAAQPSALGVLEFFTLLGKIPLWAWILAFGVAAILVAGVVLDRTYPALCFPRALTSAVAVGVGVLVMLAGQIWAVALLAPEDDKLGAKDVFIPFKLWNLAVKRLPRTHKQVWLGAWGLAIIVSGGVLVGGYEYWFKMLKPRKIKDKGLADAVAALEQMGERTEKSLEESLEDFAKKGKDALDKKKDEEKKKKEDKRPVVQCVIIGYLTSPDKQLEGLVLATLRDGKLEFAGIVRGGWSPETQKEMLEKFPKLQRPTPFIRNLKINNVIWVRPEIFCEIHQSGFSKEGQLESPNFKTLLK